MAEETAEDEVIPGHPCRTCQLWTHAMELGNRSLVAAHLQQHASVALIGLDATGRVVHRNAAAVMLLRECDCLQLHHGYLQASLANESLRLKEAILRAALSGLPSTLSISSTRRGAHACFLNVARLRPAQVGETGPGTAVVLVSASLTSQAPRLTPELLHCLFGLSRSESAVALALFIGLTPEEYAESSKHAMPTFRTHLRAIFGKTQTRRQAELVRLLSQIPL